MIFKPDEVTTLKKGRQVTVELKEGEIRVLKRNFCGVYELYKQDNPRSVEYFEDLNLFKNRHGNIHKKFPLYNLLRQRLDIYPIAEVMDWKELLKWFSEYGKVVHKKTSRYDDIEIEDYTWISDMENIQCKFQIVKDSDTFTLNISVKNGVQRAG
jgi:hypothetical protein